MLDDGERKRLADALLYDWDNLLDNFFEKVEDLRDRENLDQEQMSRVLTVGYGYEVADAYDDWVR